MAAGAPGITPFQDNIQCRKKGQAAKGLLSSQLLNHRILPCPEALNDFTLFLIGQAESHSHPWTPSPRWREGRYQGPRAQIPSTHTFQKEHVPKRQNEACVVGVRLGEHFILLQPSRSSHPSLVPAQPKPADRAAWETQVCWLSMCRGVRRPRLLSQAQ